MPSPSAFLGTGPCGSTIFFLVGATLTSPGLVIVASPQIVSILFFFIRNCTPLFICAAMARERLTMPSRSKPNFSAVRP
ncbi:hypothetical protein D3C87_1755780 [compost metagenome]